MSVRLKLRDIFEEDLDKLFSYKTPMLVLIKDRYLGLLKMLINLCILVYFVVYVIVLQKAYLAEEYSSGPAIIYATGTAVALDGDYVRVWDGVDVAYPQYDPSAIVISTRVTETIRQTQGTCSDPFRPCTQDSECLENGSCVSGFCEELSWCSSYDPKLYELSGVENFIIWIEGSIDFLSFSGGLHMTTLDENDAIVYPESSANAYLLADILEIGGYHLDNLTETGAVIKIILKWDCHITWTNDCSPSVDCERLDDDSGEALGFRYDRFLFYKDNGVQYRDYLNITGIKIFVESSGRAYALTLASIIFNVSSAINLTMLTPIIIDFLMLYVMAKKKDYRIAKFVLADLDQDGTVDQDDEKNKTEGEGKEEDKASDENKDKSEETKKPDEHFRNLP